MKLSGPLIFVILLALCTAFIWPLYEEPIEQDLTDKVKRLYINKIHNTSDIRFHHHQLQIDPEELTPYFHQKLERIIGAYIPELPAQKSPAPTVPLDIARSDQPIDQTHKQETTSFNLTRVASTVRIGGRLPGTATHDQLLALIENNTPGFKLIDQTTLAADPAPSWWDGHPLTIIPEFLRETNGHAYLSYGPDHFSAIARVSTPASLARLQEKVSKIPSSVRQDTKLSFLTPPRQKPKPKPAQAPAPKPAKAQLVETNNSGNPVTFSDIAITFGSGGSAWLHPKFQTKFETLANLIKDHPDPEQKFTVVSYGTKHRPLSKLRAKAVRDRLITLGIPAERLLTAHYPRNPGEQRRVQLTLSTAEELAAAVQEETASPPPEPEPPKIETPPVPPPPPPFANLTVNFGGSGSAWLHPKYDSRLKKAAKTIMDHPDPSQKFTVRSYGTSKRELSELRAQAVREKLISFGVPADRLLTKHFEKRPGDKRRVQLNLSTPEELAAIPEKEKEAPILPEPEPTPTPEPTPPKVVTPPPSPATLLKNLTVTFSGEHSAWIHSSYYPQLAKTAKLLLSLPETGQTFIVGSYGCPDLALSTKRAQAIIDKLIENNVPADRLKIDHFETKPGKSSRIEITLGPIIETATEPDTPEADSESTPSSKTIPTPEKP